MEKLRTFLNLFYVFGTCFIKKNAYIYLAVCSSAYGAMTVNAEESLAITNAALRAFHPKQIVLQNKSVPLFVFSGRAVDIQPNGVITLDKNQFIYDWNVGQPVLARDLVSSLLGVLSQIEGGIQLVNKSSQFAQRLILLWQRQLRDPSPVVAETSTTNRSILIGSTPIYTSGSDPLLSDSIHVGGSYPLPSGSDPLLSDSVHVGGSYPLPSASDPLLSDSVHLDGSYPLPSASHPLPSDSIHIIEVNSLAKSIILKPLPSKHKDPVALNEFEYSAPEGEEIFALQAPNGYRWNLSYHNGKMVIVVDSQIDQLASIAHPPIEYHCAEPITRRLQKYITELSILESRSATLPTTGEIFLQSTAQNSTKPNLNPRNSIPLNNVRMWINPTEEAPMYALMHFVANAKSMPGVTPIFYCIKTSGIPSTIAFLKEHLSNIKIVETSTINYPAWPKELFDGLMRDHYYTAASNLIRIFALFVHGGMYCDLGAQIHPDALKFFEHYEHIFTIRREYGSLLEGFMASVMNSPILGKILARYKHLPRVSVEYMKAIDGRNYGGIGFASSEVYVPVIYQLRDLTSVFMLREGALVNFNSMRTWVDGGRFGNVSASTNKITSTKLLSYFGIPERQIALDPNGVLLSNYADGRCPMAEAIGKHFHGLTLEQISNTRLQYHEEAVANLLEKRVEPRNSIPNIFHQIWLGGKAIPQHLLETTKTSAAILGNPRVIIWTDSASEENHALIASQIPNSETRSISEIVATMSGKAFFEELYSKQRFANASILLRHSILDRIGGLYADFGTLLKPGITEALKRFDYLFAQRSDGMWENWLDVNLMASKPNALLWKKLFAFFDRLTDMRIRTEEISPEFSTIRCFWPIEYHHGWVSGQALTAAIDALMEEATRQGNSSEERILPIAFDSLFKSGSMGSWQKRMMEPDAQVRFVHLPR